MNTELDNTAFVAGDFISENAVRDVLDRRPRTLPADAADPGAGRVADDEASPGASRSRRLRRWSVAELIAGAVARPPARRVAH